VALGASALSTVVFIVAPNVGVLFLGRILSGLSAGLMTGTATAALTELVPAPASRRASLAATAANMGGLGLGIPRRGRGEFVAAGVAGFAAFSLLGLFSALAPTFLGSVLHERSHAVQGAVVFCLLAAGTVTQLLLSRYGSRRVMMVGLGLFLAALALIVAALAQAALVLFLAGTVVGGVAVGAVFMGSLATANRLAPPGQRGQAISTYFVLCYSGLIVPVVGVGVASGFIGDFSAVLALSILLAVLCVFALSGIRRALPAAL
jgi:MFS family permease